MQRYAQHSEGASYDNRDLHGVRKYQDLPPEALRGRRNGSQRGLNADISLVLMRQFATSKTVCGLTALVHHRRRFGPTRFAKVNNFVPESDFNVYL